MGKGGNIKQRTHWAGKTLRLIKRIEKDCSPNQMCICTCACMCVCVLKWTCVCAQTYPQPHTFPPILGTSPEIPTHSPPSSLAVVVFTQVFAKPKALACFSFTLILPLSSHFHPLTFICILHCCLYLCNPLTWTFVWQERPDGMLLTLQKMSIFARCFTAFRSKWGDITLLGAKCVASVFCKYNSLKT